MAQIQMRVLAKPLDSGSVRYVLAPSMLRLGAFAGASQDEIALTVPEAWQGQVVTLTFAPVKAPPVAMVCSAAPPVCILPVPEEAAGTEGIIRAACTTAAGEQLPSTAARYRVLGGIPPRPRATPPPWVQLVEQLQGALSAEKLAAMQAMEAAAGSAGAAAASAAEAAGSSQQAAASAATASSAAEAAANSAASMALQLMPVGYIYISASPTSPEELFGGSWQQLKDTFLLAAGESYAAGESGGEASHTLTAGELPSHAHKIYAMADAPIQGTEGWGPGPSWQAGSSNISLFEGTYSTSNTGGGLPHNNMPPYLAVYCWQRVA